MDHVIFSRNARNITLVIQTLQEPSSPLLQSIARRIDNGIEGSIWKLQLGNQLLCWKLPDAQTTPSTNLPPTIGVGNFLSHETSVAFLRSLRLDQLRALEVNRIINKEEWSLFGNLPYLTDLRLFANELGLLFTLSRGTANVVPESDTLPLRPAFAVLQRLTIVRWDFKVLTDNQNRRVQEDDLARLRKLVEQVDWDRHRRVPLSETEEDSDS
ncbi:hypothetical protein C0995_003509 [Termitomyces sp. Mi166|nr:hypothetical protein C0995_003509 [Termitomyces sp. Mi166\